MLRIQLINKNMRLVGVTEDMIGKYVIADDWSVIDMIGDRWEGIASSMKMKAIRVDYVAKTILSYYDFKDEAFRNIIKGEKYDPNVGNHWGGEMIIKIISPDLNDKEEFKKLNIKYNDFTWFLCTPATRELLKPLNDQLGRTMIVSSTLVDTGRFKFYNPIITFGEKGTNIQGG